MIVGPQDGDIRLVTGKSVTLLSGRVEVYLNGAWGTVCDNNWDMNDAKVVCHQLGYSGAISAHKGARFGAGKGPIHYSRVGCQGIEERLANCRVTGSHNCPNRNKDVGVVCAGTLDAG